MTEPIDAAPIDAALTAPAPAAGSGVTDQDAKTLEDMANRLGKLERSTVVRINEWALTQEYETVPLNGLTAGSDPQPQVVLKATNVTTGEGEILVPPAATQEWIAYIEALIEQKYAALSSSLSSLASRVSSLESRMSTAESDINDVESDVRGVERDVRSCCP